jgi:hypothetical protein
MDDRSIYPTDKILSPFQALQCPHGLDYADCYESFPHVASSQTIYNSEDEFLGDESWHICEISDHFSEEFTLVTQERRRI